MIEFHPLRKSDIEEIVPMMQDFYAIDDYPINPETTRALFKTFITDENLGNCWLISHKDNIVGYVILTYVFSFEYQGKISFLDELYLNKNARGKGIGKAALDFVFEKAREKDLRIIYLEIESHNETAQKLYASNGFEIHNRKLMKAVIMP